MAAELSTKSEKFATSLRRCGFALCLGCAAYLAAAAAAQVAPTPSPAVDGLTLIDQAISRLKDIRSLKMVVWQKQHGDHAFEATAQLVLGPNHCARMDMNLTTPRGSVQRLVISDGRVMASVTRGIGEREQLRGQALPTERSAREAMLAGQGCVSPAATLKTVRDNVSRWQATRVEGVWRLSGLLDQAKMRNQLLGRGAAECRIDLDAATLWPRRLEWRHGQTLVLELEFQEAEVNCTLSPETCARLFTYTP